MSRIIIYCTEALKNFNKNRLLSVLTILLLIYTMIFCGIVARNLVFIDNAVSVKLADVEAFVQYDQYRYAVKTDADINRFYARNSESTEEELLLAIADYNEFVRLIETLESLQGENLGVIRVSQHQMNILDAKKIDSTNGVNPYVTITDEASSVYTLQVNDSFFKYESLKFVEGGIPTEEDLNYQYIATEENPIVEIPVVLGYNFYGHYSVGDILELENFYETPKEERYLRLNDEPEMYDQNVGRLRIVGILEKGTIVSSFSGSSIHELDSFLIMPYKIYIDKHFNISDEFKVKRFRDIRFVFASQKFYINRNSLVETFTILDNLLNESEFKGHILLMDCGYVNEITESLLESRQNSYYYVSVAILTFCLIRIIIVLINKYKDNLKDIAIHRLIGATDANIVLCGVVEMLFYLLIADVLIHYPIVVFPIFKFYPVFGELLAINSENTLLYPMVIIFNIVVLAITAIIYFIMGKRHELSNILKGNE